MPKACGFSLKKFDKAFTFGNPSRFAKGKLAENFLNCFPFS
jgi:hypothetical protein